MIDFKQHSSVTRIYNNPFTGKYPTEVKDFILNNFEIRKYNYLHRTVKRIFENKITNINERDACVIATSLLREIGYRAVTRYGFYEKNIEEGYVCEYFNGFAWTQMKFSLDKFLHSHTAMDLSANYDHWFIRDVLYYDLASFNGVELCPGDWWGRLATKNNFKEEIKEMSALLGEFDIFKMKKFYSQEGVKVPTVISNGRYRINPYTGNFCVKIE